MPKWIKGDFGPLRPIDFDSGLQDLTGLELYAEFKDPDGVTLPGPYIGADVGTASWAKGRVVRYLVTKTDVDNDDLLNKEGASGLANPDEWRAWLRIGDGVNELYRSPNFQKLTVVDPGE